MSDVKPYVGDVGTAIDIDVQENISTATNLKFNVLKPDDTIVQWTPTLQVDNQTLRYVTQSNDFSLAGIYKIQVGLTLGSWSGKCDTVAFEVYAAYK